MSIDSADETSPLKHFGWVLRVLLVLIVGLMALGAGVRTMNAGLSCPDWPLCFGKLIPDFHPAVWFEFVHRAYAGIVSLIFFSCFIYAVSSSRVPLRARRWATVALLFLGLQIVAGGLTVLWLVRWFAVTAHLLLATFFFCSVLGMYFAVNGKGVMREPRNVSAGAYPRWVRLAVTVLPIVILMQIALGGIVASTYAGLVCVDWPRCNGQWLPTLAGPIGHQLIHRFLAYFIAFAILGFAVALQRHRRSPWMTPQLLRLSRWNVAVVFLQVALGVVNLLLYIPPWITVPHQSVAILLLAVNLRVLYVVTGSIVARLPAARAQLLGESG